MAEGLSYLALGILVTWAVYAVSGMASPWLILVGVGVALAWVLGAQNTVTVQAVIAVLAPFGVMLPALALRHMAGHLGLPVMPFATWELILFAVLYTGFLASAMAVLPVDVYRLGYAPLPVAGMVLAVCAYGALTGNWVLPLVAVLGQLGWIMGWGSSNWFDYMLHFLMLPLVLVVLIGRLV